MTVGHAGRVRHHGSHRSRLPTPYSLVLSRARHLYYVITICQFLMTFRDILNRLGLCYSEDLW
ncbi:MULTISPECIES: hypothetical protein [unclassified Moorena]|uniref:hypothetical protein n=1 Tax=unclassified Moorena TaxID=2683338 RepID=UPI00140175EF|nr:MULTISPECIES: hypothetical protein [unclassified Moorena]NEO11243.1 hypothetical protein [Moorena sp. SIO3E8]NEP98845.1 hypothetical protein [Moorena sp. SIO3F7]